MVEYLQLCIEEQFVPKDGLTQVRTICQHTDLNSLEKVINTYLDKVSVRVKQAKENSDVSDHWQHLMIWCWYSPAGVQLRR